MTSLCYKSKDASPTKSGHWTHGPSLHRNLKTHFWQWRIFAEEHNIYELKMAAFYTTEFSSSIDLKINKGIKINKLYFIISLRKKSIPNIYLNLIIN